MIKNIKDSFEDGLKEARMQGDSKLIQNVAIMSTPHSKNGYTYSGKAMNTLATMLTGAKAFIDHPSKTKARATENVRSIRNFCGVFSNGRYSNGQVRGDLKVRPKFLSLFHDIINLSAPIGLSINAKVYSETHSMGKESITDIANLISCDLVSSPACTTSLLEAFKEDMQEEYQVVKRRIYEQLGIRYDKPTKKTEYEQVKEKVISTLQPRNTITHYGDDLRIKQTTEREVAKSKFIRTLLGR